MIYGKKEVIILIYKILSEYTDENHYLKQSEIIEKLHFLYGVDIERKAVANSINILQELDYDIVKGPKGGYALYSRVLDETEVKFINDAIFSSRTITGKNAIELSKKVSSVLSKYQRRKYTYLYKSSEINRTTNKDLFLNIELIQEAIERNKKISFQYLTFDEDGNKTTRFNGFRFFVSPYFLVNNYGKYYLLGHYRDKYKPIQNYKLDYLIDLKIEEEPLKPMKEVKGLEKLDIAEYINEHIYLFSSEVVEAKILIEQPFALQYVYEYFGDNVKVRKENNQLYVRVKSSADALYYWILQYGEYFKVIEPAELIERIQKYSKIIEEKYK